MKRRVLRLGDCRYQVELPGGDISEFSYREKPRRWDPHRSSYTDFEVGEDRYILAWEGILMDTFPTEVEVLLFILRFGYSVADESLVPSEILADLNLVYETGDWVDEWGCLERRGVSPVVGEIQRPPDRKIRFEGYPRITPRRKAGVGGTYSDGGGVGHTYSSPDRWQHQPEAVAEIEIPKLDFAELEKPKRRRFTIPRTWADLSEAAYGGYLVRQRPEPQFRPDEECVITLKIGKEAEEAFAARKKVIPDLQE